jgi:hypothetical protein
MEKHWYGNPEVSGSSPGSVKFSLPIFKIIYSLLRVFFSVQNKNHDTVYKSAAKNLSFKAIDNAYLRTSQGIKVTLTNN